MLRMSGLLILSLFTLNLCAQIPAGYYNGTQNLSGEALKAKLHDIIDDHKTFSYRDLWDILAYTDEDPDNTNNVILLYTGWSLSKSRHGGGASEWNREHTWAKSRGDFGTRRGPGTDAHHLRPTDVTVNSKRSNYDFDMGGTIYNDPDGPTENKVDNDSWEPRDAVKGDVARMLFYMATRYEPSDGIDLELTEEVQRSKQPRHGKLSVLLQWHEQDPVDDFERRRNNRVYEYQENRNPYIDHPEFVARVFGNAPAPDQPDGPVNPDTPTQPTAKSKLLIVYAADESQSLEEIATAIAAGAQAAAAVNARIKRIDQVSKTDLEEAGGVIVGSTARFASMGLSTRIFLNDIRARHGLTLTDKYCGAFALGDTNTGGTHLVVTSLVSSLLDLGALIAGPLYRENNKIIGGKPGLAVNESELLAQATKTRVLEDAGRLGRRLGELLAKP